MKTDPITDKDSSYINIKEEFEKHPLPTINKKRISGNDFVNDLIITSNLVNKFLLITAGLITERPIDKIKQGILIGHIVRLYKLYDSFILLICNNRTEVSLLTARAIAETSIVLKYLINNIDEDDICNKFIKSSLSYDKKLWDFIQKNISGREPQSFEIRLLESISQTFKKTNFSIEEISYKKDKNWYSNLFALSTNVGLQHYYETVYRIGSSATHGTWHHLEYYHLNEQSNSYEPELINIAAPPQLLEGVSIMGLHAAIEYVKFMCPDEMFINYLHDVAQWYSEMGEQHELFLSSLKTDAD